MTDKNPFLKNHIFEGKIKQYEQILIDFVLDSGRAKSVDPNLQKILGFISIHQKLTQTQLKDLTGLSRASISKKLRALLALKAVKKERIPKTNEYLYTNTPESYGDTADATLDDFSKINEFLKKKLIEIERCGDIKGAEFFSERVKGLINTFETVHNIWADIEFIFTQKKEEN
ncbi:MAG: MarR family transcriptional regulator [Candidatus Odinarchaeota archaeon]